jgi:hypothetical protein
MGWSDLKHDLQRFLEWADVSVNCAETEARPALTVLALVLKDQVDEGVYRFVTPPRTILCTAHSFCSSSTA